MSLDDDFADAIERANAMPTQSTNIQLELYGLYKQASQGDVSGDRPGLMDIRRRAKWDAWKSRKGLGADEAKQAYIDYVDELEAS